MTRCPDCGETTDDGACERCGWRTAARAHRDTMRRVMREKADALTARNLVAAGLAERPR
jgi:hypothetical protein